MKYAGIGLPKDGEYLEIRIPLVKKVETYDVKDKEGKPTGEKKTFTSYAQCGSRFGGLPIGDGTLAIKLTVYPQSSKRVDTTFELI